MQLQAEDRTIAADVTARMKPARISVLVVAVQWPPETFIWQTVRGLADAGLSLLLAVSVRPGQKVPASDNIGIIRLPTWSGSWPYRLVTFSRLLATKAIRYPAQLSRLWGLLTTPPGAGRHTTTLGERIKSLYRLLPYVGLRPDMLHFQWNSAAIEYSVLFDFFQCPVVISCRGTQINVAPHDPRRQAIRDGVRETFAQAQAVHCVSNAIKQEAMAYGLDASKAWVIRPAVDLDFFSPSEQTPPTVENTFSVITVGSLRWVKGYEYALQAIQRLVRAGVRVRYTIIGDGPERQRVLFTVHDLGLQDSVTLYGNASPQEVRELLRQADVFLCASISEGISNAVLEAMACGLPVVTTNAGGMGEAVQNRVEGFVVPARDTAAMAAALQQLAASSDLRARLGRAARARVVTGFSLPDQVAALKEMYASLLGQPITAN